MAEIRNPAQARAAFETLCRTLDKENWRYKKDEEALSISCGARGEDLPIDINFKVDEKRMLVMLLSHLPLVVQEDKRLDVAIAATAINNRLVDGCFDYDVTDGHMFFRMTNSIIDTTLSEDVYEYMLYCSCQTIDEYNDKFLMIAKGMISIQQFLASLNQ